MVPVQVRKSGTKAAYCGETGRSILVRGVQCLADNKTSESKKSKANAFVKHTNESTVERCQAISSHFLIVDEHPKPLQHQIREGVLNRRGEQGQDVLINSKLDHFCLRQAESTSAMPSSTTTSNHLSTLIVLIFRNRHSDQKWAFLFGFSM